MTQAATGSTHPAARIVRVTKHYDTARALADVSFEVATGELLTLLGPSGCGKTTTMRAIAGLEAISDGEIFLKERLVRPARQRVHVPPEKRDVGMVFQSYAIWPHMTVFENVAYPLRCRRVASAELKRRVAEGLHLVGMDEFAARPATQLSGGQQQRVALARAIVMQPSVLLLDEPLSNLDAKLRWQMRSYIKSLQRRTGLTMIYVTHDQGEAMALSDRIVVMNGGRVEQIGSPEAIYERPNNPFVADFVGATNFVRGMVTALEPDQGLAYVEIGGAVLACAVDGADRPRPGAAALLMIRPEKITVAAAETQRGRAKMNRVTATVAANVYCGDHRELTLQASGVSLRALVPATVTAATGAEVALEFAARDLRLLPEAQNAEPHGEAAAPRPREEPVAARGPVASGVRA